MDKVQHLEGHARSLAYRLSEGAAPVLVFLHGWLSDMGATKAGAIGAWAQEAEQACLLFDFAGHGQSEGEVKDFTISEWRDDVLAMLDLLAPRPVILVGSSFGGYMALLAAVARPEQTAGVGLIAPAVDLTERLLARTLTDAMQKELTSKGATTLISPDGEYHYPISRRLLEDGKRHLLFDQGGIEIACPVRIMHGQRDDSVAWKLSLKLMEQLKSEDVRLTLFKRGEHSLNEADELASLQKMCAQLVRLA